MNDNSVVRLERDGDIAVIVIDSPSPAVLSTAARSGLNSALTDLADLADIRGILLRSAGSLEAQGSWTSAEDHALLNRIEQLQQPVLALIDGNAFGAGLEFSLACHYRAATPTARFGLPQITLGSIPGAGGTQRLPRLIGIEQTLQLVLSAQPVDAATALRLGFIDSILEGEPIPAGLAYLRSLIETGKGARRTCDMTVPADSVSDEILRNAALQANQMYPTGITPFTAIKAISASARLGFERGLQYEAELLQACHRRRDAEPPAKAT